MEIYKYILVALITGISTFAVVYKIYVLNKNSAKRAREVSKLQEYNKSINNYNILVKQYNNLTRELKDCHAQSKDFINEKFKVQKIHNDEVDQYQNIIHELKLELLERDGVIKLLFAVDENRPHPSWKKDFEGRIITVNKEYESWKDTTFKECRGKTDIEVYGKEKGKICYEHDMKLINNNYSYYVDVNVEMEGWVVIKTKSFAQKVLVFLEGNAYKLPDDVIQKSTVYVR